MSLTTSPDKKIFPGFWWLVEHTEDEQGGKQRDESTIIIHWMLKMEQEAAVQKFRKERMVGDGVREEDAKKNTGLRLSQRVFSWAVTEENRNVMRGGAGWLQSLKNYSKVSCDLPVSVMEPFIYPTSLWALVPVNLLTLSRNLKERWRLKMLVVILI